MNGSPPAYDLNDSLFRLSSFSLLARLPLKWLSSCFSSFCGTSVVECPNGLLTLSWSTGKWTAPRLNHTNQAGTTTQSRNQDLSLESQPLASSRTLGMLVAIS